MSAERVKKAKNMPEVATPARAAEKDEGWGETLKIVFYAILIALVVRTFLFEPFNIPSQSMEPTLKIGDYLFVSKSSYGYSRYSLPFNLPLMPRDTRLFYTAPERGDVAVFKLPSNPSLDYIKRVIGLPGDRIQMIEGVLHINGRPVELQEDEDYMIRLRGSMGQWNDVAVRQLTETLPNGVAHPVLRFNAGGMQNNTDVFVVPPDHFFMMGDNRDRSNDSRVAEVGYVHRRYLVGRAEIMFFSIREGEHFWAFWRWPQAIRWKRLFDGIN